MTMVELAQEARELAKEYWWNGVGAVVLAFLLVTSIWRNGDDYLLYAALIFVVVHAGVAMWGFGHRRAQRLDEKHRRELVVAYRRGLEQAQNTHTEETHERPRGRRVPAFAVVTRRAA